MNISDPIKTNSKQAVLADGIEVEIVGEVFDNPIFQTGPSVYNMVVIYRVSDRAPMGTLFYEVPFSDQELVDKVNEIAENPNVWLAPAYKTAS